ncbi:hypothetical protein [Micromonospora sp. NPDC049497]|uniref:hypothetical protein n=1 Tax=Micromonospora sp. NPDC049497 TaxID=3364273 RepID=UPI00378E5CF2
MPAAEHTTSTTSGAAEPSLAGLTPAVAAGAPDGAGTASHPTIDVTIAETISVIARCPRLILPPSIARPP